MQQQIIQVGNSSAVIIPKATMDKYGWKVGNKIHILEDDAEQEVKITTRQQISDGLTPEYFAWKKQFLAKNKVLLSRLAKFHGKSI